MIDSFIRVVAQKSKSILDSYLENCNIIDEHVKNKYKFRTNFSYERSIAAFFSMQYIEKLMKTSVYSQVIGINEFSVKIDESISPDKFDELKGAYGLKHIKTPKKSLQQFYPDTYMMINKNDDYLDIFIEYKIKTKFVLAELSYDFMKYILYSNGSKNKSIFTFIMFKKNNDGKPTLIYNDEITNVYEIKTTDLEKELEVIGETKSVFIYKNIGSERIDNNSLIEIDILREMNKVINDMKEKRLNDNSVIEAEDFMNNPFIRQMSKFGENVIISEIIRNNFTKLLEIKKCIIQKEDLELNFSEKSPIDLEIFLGNKQINENAKKDFIEKISSYFNNQMKCILKNVKQNRSVFNLSYKRANWILIIIAKFLDLNKLNSDIDNFTINDFCENDEDAREIMDILLQAYEEEEYIKNINSLAMSLIYYIIEVYPIIFIITENNIIMKNQYLAYKTKDKLFHLVHDFKRMKKGVKRMNKQDWDEFDLEVELKQIAIAIFSKYLKFENNKL